MKIADILGVRFHAVTRAQSVQIAMEHIHRREKMYVSTPNAEIAYLCYHDTALKNLINASGLVLPDGIGIVYAAKIMKQPITEKVAGVDFADALMSSMAKEQKRIFFLGGKPGIAEQAAKNLAEKYPGLVIAGVQDGYFQEDAQAVAAINAANGVDVTFVCLGAPKQERFMASYQDQIQSTILCGLGGSLDVFAGVAQRAPDIFIRLGLEWFYRLLKEPRRIGRMMSLPKFMLLVLRKKIFGK